MSHRLTTGGGSAVMTGPNLASEIAAGQPTAAVIAFQDPDPAVSLQKVFMGPTFRVYTNDDVAGCELGGALKNVMAIASGMSDGLGFGDNTRHPHHPGPGRGHTSGDRPGWAPVDLRRAGRHGRPHRHLHLHQQQEPPRRLRLARGETLEAIVEQMQMVAEGSRPTRAVLDLAARHEIEMPIATHVGMVLYEGMHPRGAVLRLMTRGPKSES